jgi:plastocyanin
MRKFLLLTLALLAVAAAPATEAATRHVAIARSGFVPASITVTVGDTVTWTNNDSVNRSVVSDTGLFASGLLTPGQSFSYTFIRAATFRYRDGTRTGERGTVTVRAPAATVSLTSNKQSVIFGNPIELSGQISTKQSGKTVTIVVTPMGEQATRVMVTTGTDGVWRYVANPRIQTSYTAQYLNVSSAAVSVAVRPKITLRKIGTTRYTVTVTAARSLAGKIAYIARWSPRYNRWIQVRRFVLAQSRTSATSAVATMTIRVARRTKLRGFMSTAQASPGYISGYSNVAQA